MKDIYLIAENEGGLSQEEIKTALLKSLEGRSLKKVLILPPDFTRFHSNAGYITNVYYHTLTDLGVKVDEKISDLRNLKILDEFRSEEFPDDILVFFFKEGCSAEGMWVRYEDTNEEKEIFGTLLSQPNQNMGINKGDRIKFNIIKAEGDSFCCCDLDE